MQVAVGGADCLHMSYLKLDDERLLAIIDGLNRILGTSLDPEEVGTVGAGVAQRLAGATGAEVRFVTEGPLRRVRVGDDEATAGSVHLPLERDGRAVGTLIVTKRGSGLDEADVEALRLLAEGLAGQLENASLYAQTARESRVDPLTGLGNRMALEERVEWELSRAHRYGEPLSMAMFRIDDYESLQERFGPEGIDAIMVEVAEVLSRGRSSDAFFRIAPDQLAVIMPNTSDEGAEIAAIRIAWEVANLRDADGTVTASTGVAQADIPDPRAFIAAAESALRRVAAPALSG